MNFKFSWVEKEEVVKTSRSFLRELKRFLIPIFEENLYTYFDTKLLMTLKWGDRSRKVMGQQ